MNVLGLAQSQFSITTVYHFFFVPLTLGLSILVAIMETLYVRRGDLIYKQMAQFWGKLFLINFAMGVVTGLVMEFQFGMNWSEYSRFVGDIFGAPLAIEGLTAFFLESTFIGIWIFGWDKVPKAIHALSMWLVAFGATLSALWILIANSFMHYPVGYVMVNGRPVMDDFWAIISNPHVWTQFPHTVFSGYTTGAFFVMGISVFHLLKKSNPEFFKKSFMISTIFGLFAIVGSIGIGHQQAQLMVKQQPMKMAAAEMLWDSENPAALSVFSVANLDQKKNIVDVRIPGALSFLSYNRFTGEVLGMNDIQTMYEQKYGSDNYIPPVYVSYWSFRIMIAAGFLMLFLVIVGIWLWKFKKFNIKSKLWYGLTAAIILPYLANTAGWLLTEVGRQPWVVYGLLRTADAVSPNVTAAQLLTTLIGFTVVYGILIVVDVTLLYRIAKAGPIPESIIQSKTVEAAA